MKPFLSLIFWTAACGAAAAADAPTDPYNGNNTLSAAEKAALRVLLPL